MRPACLVAFAIASAGCTGAAGHVAFPPKARGILRGARMAGIGMPGPAKAAPRVWPPSKAECADFALSAAGAACAISALSVLDSLPALRPYRFYAPPYGAIVLLLFGESSTPDLGTMAATTALAVFVAQLLALARIPVALTRGLTCGLALLLARLYGLRCYPPSGALALFFLENCEPLSMSLSGLLCPAVTGHAVIVPIAWAVLLLRRRVRAALESREGRGES